MQYLNQTNSIIGISARMLDSACVLIYSMTGEINWSFFPSLHFSAGFFGVQEFQNDYHQLIMIETPGQNNTLAPFENCANANNAVANIGTTASNAWSEIYLAPTLKRLSPLLKGFNLTITDLVAMQQLCAYEVRKVISYKFTSLMYADCLPWVLRILRCFQRGWVEWLRVLRRCDWALLLSCTYCSDIYCCILDLSFWYGNGPGNPASSAQGIGYVQELVSRLTQTRITSFNSAVNSSIVTNPVQFPLNQSIFVDASHDTVISTSQFSIELNQYDVN